jgi:hypothetical protein
MTVKLLEKMQSLGSVHLRLFSKDLRWALFPLLLLGGCASISDSKKLSIPRFHLEAPVEVLNDPRVLRVQLPVSQTMISVSPVPAIPGFDLESIALEETRDGVFLRFTLKSAARMELMRMADSSRGRRLVLMSGEEAIGAWRIDRIPTNGELWVYPEMEPADLNQWVNQVKHELNAQVGR